MNILILNASPKIKGGASRYFGKILKGMLVGCKVTTAELRNKNDILKAIPLLKDIDRLIISAPLYNDSVPAHLLPFLSQAEEVCREKNYNFKVYAISNSGFVEGIQNKTQLKIYEAWAERAKLSWCGGLGIGGGVMLQVLSILMPIFLIITGLQIGTEIVQSGYITFGKLLSVSMGLLITIGLSIGVYWNEFWLSLAIRKGKTMTNAYTRVLIPSFIFLIIADIFMGISFLFNIKERIKIRQNKIR